jgi:hypothetical protein
MDVQNRGFVFAKCTICESLKDLISKVGKNNPSVKEHEIKFKKITFIRNLVGIYITFEKLNIFNLKKIFCV